MFGIGEHCGGREGFAAQFGRWASLSSACCSALTIQAAYYLVRIRFWVVGASGELFRGGRDALVMVFLDGKPQQPRCR